MQVRRSIAVAVWLISLYIFWASCCACGSDMPEKHRLVINITGMYCAFRAWVSNFLIFAMGFMPSPLLSTSKNRIYSFRLLRWLKYFCSVLPNDTSVFQ